MAPNIKQEARRRATEQFQKRHEEHLAREARIRELVIRATTAVLERDQVLAKTDREISEVLHELARDDIPTAEAAALCGLEPREANRLRRVAAPSAEHSGDGDSPTEVS